MIRLNAFFKVKNREDIDKAVNLGNALVEKSLNDPGCVAYGLFRRTDGNNDVFMFCETWTDDKSLASHASSEHFTTIVPQIEALSEGGLKLERFEF